MSRSSIEEKLTRYEKIDFLGEGQFATVYKVQTAPATIIHSHYTLTSPGPHADLHSDRHPGPGQAQL